MLMLLDLGITDVIFTEEQKLARVFVQRDYSLNKEKNRQMYQGKRKIYFIYYMRIVKIKN